MWERLFPLLARERDNDDLMIDGSIVCAHAQAATGQKGGLRPALGRSRGGLASKWHIAVDTLGRPIRFILTGGNASDTRLAIPLLTGPPRRRRHGL